MSRVRYPSTASRLTLRRRQQFRQRLVKAAERSVPASPTQIRILHRTVRAIQSGRYPPRAHVMVTVKINAYSPPEVRPVGAGVGLAAQGVPTQQPTKKEQSSGRKGICW
jgi:hypothetical protein